MAAVLPAALLALLALAHACVDPAGLDDGSRGALASARLSLPAEGIFQACLGVIVPGLKDYETPIALRNTHILISTVYSAVSAYEPVALERFGRRDVSAARRRCARESGNLPVHRRVSLAYALMLAGSFIVPGSRGALEKLLRGWGLDPARCPGGAGCGNVRTPWGLAWAAFQDVRAFGAVDGWNADGSLSRQFNRVPYEDYRRAGRYVPRNSPWRLAFLDRWQPLPEDNGRGYITHQEHVVPHVGYTGRSLHFGDNEFCAKKLNKPRYDYRREINALFRRTTKLNELKKAEIVAFDSKVDSLIPLQLQYYVRRGFKLDSFDIIAQDLGVISATYEAVLVVWKEKVRHDLVRPPSIIRALLGGRRVKAYAGPNRGTANIPAQEFVPYIRTMPHAEFPSASSCICRAFQEAMIEFTGSDDVTGKLGGPLSLKVKRGSNPVEANTPGRDMNLAYSSWSAIGKACSDSRLNGGMHFTAAVPEGERLCTGIGKTTVSATKKLMMGVSPNHVTRFNAPVSRGGRCKA